MENHSLNKLSWEKLKNNRTAYFSLFFIIFCVIISLFSVLISPDKTPMANEMHIELSALEPFSDVTFLEIPKNCHYFIVEDNEFNLWLNNKITFEEVLGTRRFRYNRNPNIYRVEINQIYTNFL